MPIAAIAATPATPTAGPASIPSGQNHTLGTRQRYGGSRPKSGVDRPERCSQEQTFSVTQCRQQRAQPGRRLSVAPIPKADVPPRGRARRTSGRRTHSTGHSALANAEANECRKSCQARYPRLPEALRFTVHPRVCGEQGLKQQRSVAIFGNRRKLL
jgi:hypothetical protein